MDVWILATEHQT